MEKHEQNQLDSDDSSSAGDFEQTAFLNSQYVKQDSKRRQIVWLTFFNLFLFTLSAMALTCAVVTQRSQATYSAAALMDRFSVFSPAMNVVEYEHVQFQMPNPLSSSPYIGNNDNVDKAWMDIAYMPDQMVSMDDFSKLGKSAESLKVMDPKSGETGYRVGLEVFNQLHCLNMLRMATYPENHSKLWFSDMNDGDESVRAHLDHCVEILRMNLQCYSDVNVFTYRSVPGKSAPSPDYESHHVCRNFDKIKQWANENAMPAGEL